MTDGTAVGNTIARYFQAVDERDWDRVQSLMTNPIHLDYSSFGAGDPADLEPAQVVAGWKQLLPGFDHTHHQLGNLDLEVSGDEAAARCSVIAMHRLGDEIWTAYGAYEKTLRLEAGIWRVSSSRFLFKDQTGATDLPAKAQEAVLAQASG